MKFAKGLRPKESLKKPIESLSAEWGGGTMGCHPMLTENDIFVTNALRGDLSTVNVRQCSVHQWIGN